MSNNRWVNKDDVVRVYSDMLLTIKKSEMTSFAATWMDLESIMLNEVSQKEKDKYHTISLICGI